ncbi:hypothetical protein AAFC00_002925 [Neodothiora populina]|uniref:Subtelomeric hrmA-associated cluster protein AFUB-079030/YDR124W-like helical bundle domain-containing protein n=1 Tax=Neodothiora populina TaxID=2781224 RepID=A0ABR3P9F5_9PEZI
MVANSRLRPQYGKQSDTGRINADSASSFDSQGPEAMYWRSQMRGTGVKYAGLTTSDALDEQCSLKSEASKSNEWLQVIIGNWSNLSHSEREKCMQIASRSNTVCEISSEQSELVPSQAKSNILKQSNPKGKTKWQQKPRSSRLQPKPKSTSPSKSASRKRKQFVDDESDSDDDWEEIRRPQDLPSVSFRVNDKEKVQAFLYTRFMQIQQSAGKVIAKAWIKAICPKKQANYPYVDCNPRPDQPRRRPRHAGPPRVPIFWPGLDVCRHKEPDHLDKNERTYLLVHLIRIAWGPKEWKQSNGESCEVPKLIMSGDWIQFLQEVFPAEKLAEVPGSTGEKTKQRVQYLNDIYKVALAEQEYLQGGNDGRTMLTFTGDVKLLHPKDARSRRTRPNNSIVSELVEADPVERSTTPISTAPTVTTSTSPSHELTESPKFDERQGISESKVLEVHKTRTQSIQKVREVDVSSGQSSSAIPNSPWIVVAPTESDSSVLSPTSMQSMQGLKTEQSIGPRDSVGSAHYFSPLAHYASPQGHSTISNAPVWGENFGPYMTFTPASFSGEATQVTSGNDTVYRQDMGMLDPMLGGLTIRSQAVDAPFYAQDQKLFAPLTNISYPVMYGAEPSATQMYGGAVPLCSESYSTQNPQGRGTAIPGHRMSIGMEYMTPMSNAEGVYAQAELVSGEYQQF